MSAVESRYDYRNPRLGEAFNRAHFLHIFTRPPSEVVVPEVAIKGFMQAVNVYLVDKGVVLDDPQEFFNTAVDFLIVEREVITQWVQRDPRRSVTQHLLKFYFGLEELGFNYSHMPTGDVLLESRVLKDSAGEILATFHPRLPGFDRILSKKIDVCAALASIKKEKANEILGVIKPNYQDWVGALDALELTQFVEQACIGFLSQRQKEVLVCSMQDLVKADHDKTPSRLLCVQRLLKLQEILNQPLYSCVRLASSGEFLSRSGGSSLGRSLEGSKDPLGIAEGRRSRTRTISDAFLDSSATISGGSGAPTPPAEHVKPPVPVHPCRDAHHAGGGSGSKFTPEELAKVEL